MPRISAPHFRNWLPRPQSTESYQRKPASVKIEATALTPAFLLQPSAYNGCEKSCLKLRHRADEV